MKTRKPPGPVPPEQQARTARELLKKWDAAGMPKTSLYWRLKQLEAEGK